MDRINGDMAVLLLDEEGGQKLVLPLASLPVQVREGDWLRVSFELDEEKRKSVRDEIDRLMNDLGDNP